MSKFKSNIALAIIASISFGLVHSSPIKIHRSNYLGSRELESKKAELYHDDKGFMVKIGDEVQEIQNCFIDKELRNLDSDRLQILLGNKKVVTIGGEKFSFTRACIEAGLTPLLGSNNAKATVSAAIIAKKATLKIIHLDGEEAEEVREKLLDSGSYILVNVLSDGEITLKLRHRLDGGGPIVAAIGYWFVKTACYGTAVAAAGTAVVATGGAAGAVIGGTLAGATAGASVGATVIGGAIAGGGLATEAAVITLSAATSMGTIAATVAAVESVSLGVSTWLLFLPTP